MNYTHKNLNNLGYDETNAKNINIIAGQNIFNNNNELSSVNFAAYNDDVGIVWEDLNATGNADWLPPTTSETLSVVSTSAEDAFGNTGVQIYSVTGLDENYEPQSVVVVLTGLTPVAVTGNWKAVNDVRMVAVGSYAKAVGEITIYDSQANIWHDMKPDETYHFMGRYTVRAGYQFHIKGSSFSAGASGDFQVEVVANPGGIPMQRIAFNLIHQNTGMFYVSPETLPEFTTIKIRALRDSGGGGDKRLYGYIFGTLIKNSYISRLTNTNL